MIHVLRVVHDTMVDGPGLRTSIYCAGCPHACLGCHNPQSWAFGQGERMTTETLMDEILTDSFADVTFTGGDPMAQAAGFLDLAKVIREQTHKTIWCYTGFTFEDLLQNSIQRALLEELDVLVDGRFIASQKDEDLLFRGSRNQRLIDVKRSLSTQKVVLWEADSVMAI